MRVLAVDYGDRRVGLAVSDALGIAAHGLDTLEIRTPQQAAKAVARTAREKEAERIVVGVPLNMDGTSGERAEVTENFCEEVRKRTDIPVEVFDERWTTMRAERTLHEGGIRARDQKKHVDKLAAVLILQDYLGSQPGAVGGGAPWSQ